MNKSLRNYRIDYIRVIGTFLVILAHVSIPQWLDEIRTFDVISLVYISGISMLYSREEDYGKYIKKRFKKLVLPVYFIISLIFIIAFFYCSFLRGGNQLFSWTYICRSYLFCGGMGYIWIVKVYMMIAIFMPILKKITLKIKSEKMFLTYIIIVYLVYVILEMFFGKNIIMYEYFFQIFPYILIANIGLRVVDDQKKNKKIFLICFAITIICAVISGGFHPSQFKFPPKLFYIAYGLMIVSGLVVYGPKKKNSIIIWISKNSFNIYIWHIFYLFIINAISDFSMFSFLNIWFVSYTIISIASIISALVSGKIKHKLYKAQEGKINER